MIYIKGEFIGIEETKNVNYKRLFLKGSSLAYPYVINIPANVDYNQFMDVKTKILTLPVFVSAWDESIKRFTPKGVIFNFKANQD